MRCTCGISQIWSIWCCHKLASRVYNLRWRILHRHGGAQTLSTHQNPMEGLPRTLFTPSHQQLLSFPVSSWQCWCCWCGVCTQNRWPTPMHISPSFPRYSKAPECQEQHLPLKSTSEARKRLTCKIQCELGEHCDNPVSTPGTYLKWTHERLILCPSPKEPCPSMLDTVVPSSGQRSLLTGTEQEGIVKEETRALISTFQSLVIFFILRLIRGK